MSSTLATNILLIIIAVDLIAVYSKLEKLLDVTIKAAMGKKPTIMDLNN